MMPDQPHRELTLSSSGSPQGFSITPRLVMPATALRVIGSIK
jgi:hypothetical protein